MKNIIREWRDKNKNYFTHNYVPQNSVDSTTYDTKYKQLMRSGIDATTCKYISS